MVNDIGSDVRVIDELERRNPEPILVWVLTHLPKLYLSRLCYF